MPTGYRTTTKRVVQRDPESGFFAFIWRHRVGLGPILYGAGVYVLALILRYIFQLDLQMYGISAGIAAVVACLFIRFTTSDREAAWHARRNQNYLYIVTAATGGWAYWFLWLPPGTASFKLGSTVFFWALLTLAIPYWFDLRRRTRVMLDNKLDSWPLLTEGTRFMGSKVSGFRKKQFGWKLRLWVPPGRSAREIMNSQEFMEQTFDEPPGSVVIDPVPGKSNVYEVTCVNNDPHEQPIIWDEDGVDSITDSAFIGKYGDHRDEKTAWWTRGVGGFHRLFGGLTRSGKSGLFHLLLGIYSQSKDTVFWLADLKDGTALLPWSPVADWTVTTVEDAVLMVQAAKEVVAARSRYLAKQGREVWEPSRAHPVLVLFIDEIAELLGVDTGKVGTAAAKALISVARKGAGVGVLLAIATQYPTLDALNSSQFRSQIGWRACFRVANPSDAQYIIPRIMNTKLDASSISKDRKGTCYVDAEGEMRMSPLRILYMAHEHITNIVNKWFGTRPSMDADSLKWHDKELVAKYQDRIRWTPDMLERMRNGELEGYTGDDLLDAEDDEILFGQDPDDVATEDDGQPAAGGQDLQFSGQVAKLAALEGGQRPAIPRSWWDSELGRAAMEHMRRSGIAGYKAREAWLSEHKEKPLNEARQLFEQELDKAQVEGTTRTVAELAAVCGRDQRTIYRWVEEGRAARTLERISNGKYRRVSA